MISLAIPWALALLPLPLLVWRFAPPHREQVAATRVPFFRRLTDAAGIEARPGARVPKRSRWQMFAALCVWGLIVVALARPERLGEPLVIEKSARDIVLALDISGSMDERDFALPDGQVQQRLAAVKEVLKAFIGQRDGDRMALIVFGTKAFVQAPFTDDLVSLNGFLDQTVVGMAGPNTAIGDAIGLSVRLFDASDVPERLVILLSDGADNSSRMTPINAAAIAADRGVTIQTIGVGDPEASGEDRVDLDTLEDIAKRTGGAYFYADNSEALTEVYDRIDAMAPRKVEQTSFRPTQDLTWVAAGAAVLTALAALTGLLLPRRRRTA
ncbi:VWA domain-containing protein [Sedimentitalea sp. JM2-8]|uniref:VWA domain-containing protein n=1 Tax=Sedimentitalea xiamensis TaxID=3050037 RepID=A0ABT7FF62_9RHOB|nr:VWA domain-containing protein [Sedimentitalea xiamensis]MDK3073761.1 VWA domain-containing protein [Sedimentitalea xiamensis]